MVPSNLMHTLICHTDKALEWNFVWTSSEALEWLHRNMAAIEKEPVWVYLVNEDMYLKVKEKFEQLVEPAPDDEEEEVPGACGCCNSQVRVQATGTLPALWHWCHAFLLGSPT
jgi:hypothetical protein